MRRDTLETGAREAAQQALARRCPQPQEQAAVAAVAVAGSAPTITGMPTALVAAAWACSGKARTAPLAQTGTARVARVPYLSSPVPEAAAPVAPLVRWPKGKLMAARMAAAPAVLTFLAMRTMATGAKVRYALSGEMGAHSRPTPADAAVAQPNRSQAMNKRGLASLGDGSCWVCYRGCCRVAVSVPVTACICGSAGAMSEAATKAVAAVVTASLVGA